MSLPWSQMKSRWVFKGITACMNIGRQASLEAADTLSGPIAFLPLHCVGGTEQSCCQSGHTHCLHPQRGSQRSVARHHGCSSACGEYVRFESPQSVRASSARGCLPDNDRALPRQTNDYPWQSSQPCQLCWGAGDQYATTDHQGEHNVGWSSGSSEV